METHDAKLSTIESGRQEHLIRPLEGFSTFVATQLHEYNYAIQTSAEIDGKRATPDMLFTTLEDHLGEIPPNVFDSLEVSDQVANRRVALIDLLFAIRSLDVAYKGDDTYHQRLESSQIYQRAQQLASIEGRLPTLQWVDTATYYPSDDPRSFLANTPEHPHDRDDEIALYRTNREVDGIFKAIVQKDLSHPTEEQLNSIVQALEAAVDTLRIHAQNRDVGNFARLNDFSGPKIGDIIIASGSFSAWTHLVGWLFTGADTFRQRFLNDAIIQYFDQDAKKYIDLLRDNRDNGLPTIQEYIAQVGEDLKKSLTTKLMEGVNALRKFDLLHRGVVKKFAPDQFDEPSPTNTDITNRESINAAIDALQQVRLSL